MVVSKGPRGDARHQPALARQVENEPRLGLRSAGAGAREERAVELSLRAPTAAPVPAASAIAVF